LNITLIRSFFDDVTDKWQKVVQYAIIASLPGLRPDLSHSRAVQAARPNGSITAERWANKFYKLHVSMQ